MTRLQSVSIIVPVLNPGGFATRFIDALGQQTVLPDEIIVMNSGSSVEGLAPYKTAGARIIAVPRSEFGHGKTRNLAARYATGDVLVFMSQDAVPLGSGWLEALVVPVSRGDVGAAFARQVASASANPIERFHRLYNYPPESREVSFSGVDPPRSVRDVFFSNACSAVRRDALGRVGGFPEWTIMNEDMVFAARFLKAGGRIAYVSCAVVEHSHTYGVVGVFRRYFDIGVVLEQARKDLAGLRVSGAGVRFAGCLLRYLFSTGAWAWTPRAGLELAARATGMILGKRYEALPRRVRMACSMHPAFWTDLSPAQ